MGKFKNIAIELNLDQDQLKNKGIQKFVLQVAYRKQTGRYFQKIINNVFVETCIWPEEKGNNFKYTSYESIINKDSVETTVTIYYINKNSFLSGDKQVIKKYTKIYK